MRWNKLRQSVGSYSNGDIVVYTEHDELRNDISKANIVEYQWVVERYLPCN